MCYFPKSPTFNIILFLTSPKGIVFMYLFSFLSLFSNSHFIVIFMSLKWMQFHLLQSLRLNIVLWRIPCLLKTLTSVLPSILNLPTRDPWFLLSSNINNERVGPKTAWGWLLEWDWESWNLLAAKGNWSAKLVMFKRSWLTLGNQRQTSPALFTAPWVMASRMKNAYNGNGMDLRQQGQEWGRKKKGRWICVPAVAFEVP